jgi:predicted TIM-barrel fold metal-dependent hydrolase
MSTNTILVHPRFAHATTVVLREAGTGAAVLARLKNISLSGCYLETPRQVRESTRVRVLLHIADVRADVWGIVRRCDANGLGIQFTNGTVVEDWKRLESLIKELQGAAPPKSAASGLKTKQKSSL